MSEYLDQLYECTVCAKPDSERRLGSVPSFLALGCADIGECVTEDGEDVYITWGRNLDYAEQKWFFENTDFQPIHISAFNGAAELILPWEEVQQLITLLV
tara:strand:- start:1330 stop:1629 length:300 start_codon:yes stop_codon:yes gene_type:complete